MNKIIRFSIPFILVFLFLGMLIWLVGATSRVTAATSISTTKGAILVTTLEDELNSDGDCALREAIEAANTNMPVDACPTGNAVITDTITFDISGTIVLNTHLYVSDGGRLVINGFNKITISGGDSTRIFTVGDDSDLSLESMTLADGYSYTEGGGIYNLGSLAIYSSTLTENNVYGAPYTGGGGIYNLGRLTISNCTLSNNTGINGIGAGIFNVGIGTLDITRSTMSGNTAAFQGGGIANSGTLTITNSTLSANNAPYGGGISNWSMLTITNSTLVGNNADWYGGSIYNAVDNGVASLNSSIITYSPSGDNCWGQPINDTGHNIEDTNTCGFNPNNGSLPNTNPLLGHLQDNGGPTLTHALLPGSPAIDAGDDDQCPETDQRGVIRPKDGDGDGYVICDIGSFELEGPYVSPTLVTINGLGEGFVGNAYTFTAYVEPLSTTLPLEYVWQASGQETITHTDGLSDTITLIWEVPGTYAITITASSLAGVIMDTHSITITEPSNKIYLPMVQKSNEAPIGSHPSFFLPGSSALLGLIIIGVVRKWKV